MPLFHPAVCTDHPLRCQTLLSVLKHSCEKDIPSPRPQEQRSKQKKTCNYIHREKPDAYFCCTRLSQNQEPETTYIHYLTVLQVKNWWAQLVSLFWVLQTKVEVSAGLTLSQSLWEEFVPRFFWVVGQTLQSCSHGPRNPFLTGRQPEAGLCSSRLPAFHAAPPAMQVKLLSSFKPPCHLLRSKAHVLHWTHRDSPGSSPSFNLRSADYYHTPIFRVPSQQGQIQT